MGLFGKKICDVCGNEIKLLGNKKLADGNMCKACASKLSPWFTDRKKTDLAGIKEQLAYREANKDAVAAFHTTRTLGMDTKVLLDEDAGKFMVTSARNLAEANPDVMDFADVTGCELDIDENKSEIMREDKDGKRVSYAPKRYEYSYDFYIQIAVNNPFFDEIRFRLNPSTIEMQGGTGGFNVGANNVEYQKYKAMGEEIREALLQIREEVREEKAEAAAPKKAITCPYCGATTTPDASGRCEYCGGSVNG